MLLLDSSTGAVTWGEYRLDAYLTPDKFIQKYPQIPVIEEKPYTSDSTIKTYRLPSMRIGGQTMILQPRFFAENFEAIHIHRLDSENDADQDRNTEDWWREELKWLQSARELVRAQYGEPPLTRYPRLYDEIEYYPKDFLDQLLDWEYKFSWGTAGIAYISDEMVCRLWLGYKF